MKKILALFLGLAVAVTVAGCSGRQVQQTDQPQLQPVDEQAQAEIRYALSLMLDRNYIAQHIGQAGQQPASGFVPMGMTDYDGSQFYENAGPADYAGYFDVSAQAYEANYEKAFDILSKYYRYDETTGKFLDFPRLTYLYNTSEAHKAIGEYLQMVYGGIGITVQLVNQEWNTFLNTRKQGEYSIARNGWVADYNDPMCFLDMWTSDSGNNDVGLGRGEHGKQAIYSLDLTGYGYEIQVENGTWAQTYDVLIDTIISCTDAQRRYELMHLAEDMLMATGCIMPIYFYTDIYMLNQGVEGFYSNPLGYKFFHKTTYNGSGSGISVCLSSEPESIDPGLNSTVDGATLVSHLFAGLAKWEKDEKGALTLAADCAETLPEGVANEDGTVSYTYTLRPGQKWSDGQPVVAEDFVYAWNRAAAAATGSDYGYMFECIVGYEDVHEGKEGAALDVQATDERTLTVRLKHPVSYWNELLAFPTYLPVRRDVVENEAWATDPRTYVGNGAYTMTDWQHDSVITLEKNPNYHDADNVTMERIRFFLSDDSNNMLTNYKNGTWQMIDDVPTNEITTLKTQYPEEFTVTGQIGTYYVCWNANQSLKPE